MGTTGDAFRAGGGVRFQWTVTIEGYPNIITNGPTLAALDAWTGTGYTGALGGLAIQWNDGQTIKPWSKDLSIQSVRLAVQPDAGDTFGRAVFASDAGVATKVTNTLTVAGTALVVQSTALFPSSGYVCLGTETMHYSSKLPTSFEGLTRGHFGPFDLPRLHTVPKFEDSATIRPVASSLPRLWAGRELRVYAHRVVEGVLDAYTEAELVFCGRITGTADDETGLTWVEADDIRGAVQDAMLLREQWTATLKDGLFLRKGYQFRARDAVLPAIYSNATPLTVVAGTPVDQTQIQAGVYSFDDLCIAISRWLDAERVAGRLGMRYSWGTSEGDIGLRARISVSAGTDTSTSVQREFYFEFPEIVVKFMGFGDGRVIRSDTWTGVDYEKLSDEVPYRRYFAPEIFVDGQLLAYYTDASGTFVNNEEFLPSTLRPQNPVGMYGIVQHDTGEMMLVQFTTSTYLTVLNFGGILDQLSGVKFDAPTQLSARLDTPGNIGIRQVVVLNGPLHTVVMGLLASTGDSALNGPNDIFPSQLGAAIPNDLIEDLDTDLRSLASGGQPIFLALEKPTKLWTAIGCEFLLRAAALVWKSGQLRCATWSTPTESSALHNFTEANKAEPATTAGAAHRTTARDDDSYVVNVVKIQYNRILKGSSETYDSSLTVADVAAMDEVGQHAITIQARNTFAGVSASVGTVQNLAAYIAGFMSLFSRPLRVLRRSISLPHFVGVAPGDHCTVTDRNVRSPVTGARGVDGRAGLIIGHRVDFGGFEFGANAPRSLVGEVDLLLFPRARSTTYSPAAEVDPAAAGGGYNAGTKTLTFLPNEHGSLVRDLTHFDPGDKVRIIEVDPVNPATPLYWDDTLVSVNAPANTATLTTGLAGFVTTKFYRMMSQHFSVATATQKIHTYQADDATGMIEGLSVPNEYGWFPGGRGSGPNDETQAQVELGADASLVAFDGAPLDTGYERSLARMVNSLVSHRTAPSVPSLGSSVAAGGGAPSTLRRILLVERIVMGIGILNSFDRKLWVRPFFRSSDGLLQTLYLSLCRDFPIGYSRTITDLAAPSYLLVGPYQTAIYTTASTTWQHGSVHAFPFDVLDGEGTGWLVYEGTRTCETRGSSMARAGAFLDGD